MAADSKTPPTFSTSRRWAIGLDVVLRTIVVVAVIVMVNYLAAIFSRQFFLSSQTRIHLSPRTMSVLHSLTNRVDVTVYYDRDDGLFPTVMALLKEYHRIDPRIQIKVVDYLRDPGEAAVIATRYHLISSDKNMIIFDCVGADPPQFKVAPGELLAEYGPVGMKGKKIEFRPVAFDGEKMFTSMLLAITNPKPFMAYFLQSDGEPSLADSSNDGYLKFGAILRENYINIQPLSLLGTEDVPAGCNLLIIAGPVRPFSSAELSKIDHYLSQGGRLLALFDYRTIGHSTGLEDLLGEHWGVNVGNGYVVDHDNGATSDGTVMYVQKFAQHPAVSSLAGSSLLMVMPRPIGRINNPNAPNDSLTVTTLATSSENSTLSTLRGYPPQDFPLMAAVEQNPVKGIASANGNSRMIVAGDSLFLNDQFIDHSANADFASSAANWLLDRPTLLNGIGPSPVVEFRLSMTQKQMRNVRWLLLVALPGAIMAVGGLVWLRRRK